MIKCRVKIKNKVVFENSDPWKVALYGCNKVGEDWRYMTIETNSESISKEWVHFNYVKPERW